MALIFAGTPEFARVQLQALVEAGYSIALVLTQPDKPAGRGQKLTAPPVKQYAQQKGIPVLQPTTLKNPQILKKIQALNPSLMIVSAYGMLLPRSILECPQQGCWNVHASLLPRWRGAAPIQYALLKGDKQTGITLMQMDQGLDTGDMLLKASLLIEANDTAGSLHEKLANLGAKVLLQGLEKLGSLTPTKQDSSQATLAPKITKQQAHIDWHQEAQAIKKAIQAFNPWPIAWTHYHANPLKIWEAELVQENEEKHQPGEITKLSTQGIEVATGSNKLLVKRVQLPGKKALLVKEILNSKPDFVKVGDKFQ